MSMYVEKHAAIESLMAQGLTHAEIADRLNSWGDYDRPATRGSMQKIVSRHKLQPRPYINSKAADRSWMDDAACQGVDTAMFFDVASPERALAFCARCPVRAECASFAKQTKAVGVWGGKLIRGYAGGVW